MPDWSDPLGPSDTRANLSLWSRGSSESAVTGWTRLVASANRKIGPRPAMLGQVRQLLREAARLTVLTRRR